MLAGAGGNIGLSVGRLSETNRLSPKVLARPSMNRKQTRHWSLQHFDHRVRQLLMWRTKSLPVFR